jgi:hypothetical protein
MSQSRRNVLRRKKRQRERAFKTNWHCVLKHQDAFGSDIPLSHRTRKQHKSLLTAHRTTYNGKHLKFVGYDLVIARQSADMGFGLKTLVDIQKGEPITQYEGHVLTKAEANILRESKDKARCDKGNHLATPAAREFVLNGFSVDWRQAGQWTQDPPSSGIPVHIDKWIGLGGASICNHSDDNNAVLKRDHEGDGLGVFAVAVKDIKCGEFITVNYTRQFVNSERGNICKE